MKTIYPFHGEPPLDLFRRCGGYYDQTGTNGPLVGYAGKYKNSKGEEKQYVGRVYANFAKAERHGPVLRYFAHLLEKKIMLTLGGEALAYTNYCGAPEGGKALATVLAKNGQYIFPEKRITALKTAESREQSELVFDRHEPGQNENWWIVEDVCNNFSTTESLIALIESYGANVRGILCFLNRSLEVDDTFVPKEDTQQRHYPVISIVRQQIMQWKQDDPEVANAIARGKVVWKPKNEWEKIAPFIQ